ncbi:hypothetical protein ABFT80_25780 [Mesorhizobium sp. SB112]|uniref:hypothetical protein n=1 Tax=Mesorhizobium sp. SB112 TaxID=3151853 RepID=UPI00326747B6
MKMPDTEAGERLRLGIGISVNTIVSSFSGDVFEHAHSEAIIVFLTFATSGKCDAAFEIFCRTLAYGA